MQRRAFVMSLKNLTAVRPYSDIQKDISISTDQKWKGNRV